MSLSFYKVLQQFLTGCINQHSPCTWLGVGHAAAPKLQTPGLGLPVRDGALWRSRITFALWAWAGCSGHLWLQLLEKSKATFEATLSSWHPEVLLT